ncbi:hypothetical protein [Paenibacillus sp. YPG26]|uniref:hypothetical protein n=1 Tax=Paenibacillus sp. YPG26 TaxID=2878915 RepID=UPI00203AAA83|nr:hypothetical protein [Paenibacillus sp. YPG26]USB33596.1 hypothetical protein LDO05_01860 [Paenibacillus sp. YPG26]
MSKYQKLAIAVMLGIPAVFTVISLITGRWGFLLFSLPPSLVAGLTGYFAAKRAASQESTMK